MNEIVLIALRRPYTFVVMSILIVLLGTKTVLHMPTDIFPNITIPVTSVVWIYSGLLPQQVEGRITYLFERFLTSTVEGIKYIHSHSYFGSSITNIFLQDGVDVGRAEADIVGIAQNVVKALPPDISPPMVMRLAPSSIPVAMLQISSDRMTPAELYNLVYMRIRPLLVTVPGIVLPHPYGGQDMQVMVNLDLLGSFDDRGGASIGPEDITRGMLVGSREDVDSGLIGMTPGLVDPEKIIGLPKPPGRKRHSRPPLGFVPKTLRDVFRGDKHRQCNHAGPSIWTADCRLRDIQGSHDLAAHLEDLFALFPSHIGIELDALCGREHLCRQIFRVFTGLFVGLAVRMVFRKVAVRIAVRRNR